MQLRPYQHDIDKQINDAWLAGALNVLAILPTGGGKTVVFSNKIRKHNGPAVAIAHRQELVTQISLALARDKVRHKIIGPDNVVRLINRLHMEELGASYYHPNAPTAVAGVDTLVKRAAKLAHWCKTVTLWVTDESHHIIGNDHTPYNKWGTAAKLFPNARGLGVTATPVRADGKGLGRHADGLFDTMVEGPGMRALINSGYLTDYRIFAPPSDLDLSTVKTGKDGDYSWPTLKTAVRKSRIVGDVVKHYLRIAPGKLGVTFASDVETATEIATRFNAAGVPAAVVSANTLTVDRIRILRDFKVRKLLQLVNVDLFGEGFDLPAIEVVSMARPTQSFSLFAQQFGRALRLFISMVLGAAWDTYTDAQRRQFIAESVKPHAIIIDHVGNVERHGLPDGAREWTLDRQERRSKQQPSDVIPVKACPKCTAVYERIYKACPYCGFQALPMARSGPDLVDGDLEELDAEILAQMRGEAVDLAQTPAEYLAASGAGRLPHHIAMAAAKRHTAKQEAQRTLRDAIALWAGYQRHAGRPDSESYRRFYFKFGVDVLSCQALGARDATELQERIEREME